MESSKRKAIENLDFIIAKYKKMPDSVFLVYDAYIEERYDKLFYSFEVRDYDPNLAREPDILPGKDTGNQTLVKKTDFSSERSPGKKYTPLTGKEVVERALRLKSFIETGFIQPPGKLKTGPRHFGFEVKSISLNDEEPDLTGKIECRRFDSCVFKFACPKHKNHKINGLRYCGNVVKDTKVLQWILLKFGYADEMYFEKYRDDGIYGKRTRMAVSNFINEVNYIEKKNFAPANGDIVSTSLAREIKNKCEENWERKKYFFLLDKRWDLSRGIRHDEMSGLKWRCHIRQLQEDLTLFTISRMKYLPYSKTGTLYENLDELWIKGIFDTFTERAVRHFQDAATAGARFDPITRELVYPPGQPTYEGEINGIVEEETKKEIHRWFLFMENAAKIEKMSIDDRTAPPLDLTGVNIVTPSLTYACLAKEEGEFTVLLETPRQAGGIELNTGAIQYLEKSLPYFLFIHSPIDNSRPFLADEYSPSRQYEVRYTIISIEELTAGNNTLYKFYKGFHDHDTGAKYIDSEDEAGLKEDLDGNEIKAFSEEIKDKIRNIYGMAYPAFFEKLTREKRALFKITLRLTDQVAEGFYLLKVKNSRDLKPHPLRVFEKNKDGYHIVHLTDVHLATRYDLLPDFFEKPDDRYNNPNDRFRDFIKKVKTGVIPADMVLITGDVVDFANNHRPYDAKDGKYIFKAVLDKDANWRLLHYLLTTDPGINVPVYICQGNHDFRPNPASVRYYEQDLNLNETEAESYPYDLRDTFKLDEVLFKWWMYECRGDTLYADENAARYYYENFCPLTDYNITIDGINIIMMNAGTDEHIFMSEYGFKNAGETASYLLGVIKKDNPAPDSMGFNQEQLTWLKTILDLNSQKCNVFCMHNSLIKPPGSHFLSKNEVEITAEVADYKESSIVNGRDEVIDLVKKGKIKIALTGHTHNNMELRCETDPGNGSAHWYLGRYSSGDENLPYFNRRNNRLVLSTIPGGALGFHYAYDKEYYYDSSYTVTRKKYSKVGCRVINLSSTGLIRGFKETVLWRKRE